MPEYYSLFQLNEYLKRVIALNFADPLWIVCEIAQINEVRGNSYLDLIQKKEDEEEIIAQSKATIWYKQGLFLSRKLGDWRHDILQEGIEIKCKVEVEFSERFGLNLKIIDLDPSYTLGKMALQRKKILDQLQHEGLVERNSALPMPMVFRRIALISSSKAAGLQDFLKHVGKNSYGYTFEIHLFESSMQGCKVGNEVCEQLDKISETQEKFDIVCIVRGGGSKLDLSGFDNYEIGKRIAQMPIPVITGIGHEIDETIADVVAYKALKTPTAVASFIIDHQLNFETLLIKYLDEIKQMCDQQFLLEERRLNHYFNRIIQLSNAAILEQLSKINLLDQQINHTGYEVLLNQEKNIQLLQSQVELLDPINILKRGYSLSFSEGRRVKSVQELQTGKSLETVLEDGSISSTVNQIKPNEH